MEQHVEHHKLNHPVVKSTARWRHFAYLHAELDYIMF